MIEKKLGVGEGLQGGKRGIGDGQKKWRGGCEKELERSTKRAKTSSLLSHSNLPEIPHNPPLRERVRYSLLLNLSQAPFH